MERDAGSEGASENVAHVNYSEGNAEKVGNETEKILGDKMKPRRY